MKLDLAELLTWAPAFALVLARIGAMMTLLPGLGESVVPGMVRVAIAMFVTVLLLPTLLPLMPPVPSSGLAMGLMVVGEVVTGMWFGWLARMIMLALPMAAQFAAYFLGISSVLQPDAELGAQSTALSKLFELAAPVIMLASGLYTVPLKALVGLFQLIPPGQMLPSGDGLQVAVHAVATAFALALRVASPFVVATILWYFAVGQVSRVVSRMQIYFVAMPGQILGGLALLALVVGAMSVAWQNGVGEFLSGLPGSG
jgi:flagellar biosynthetic protein FliR